MVLVGEVLPALEVVCLHSARRAAEEVLRAARRGKVIVITTVLGDLKAEFTVHGL